MRDEDFEYFVSKFGEATQRVDVPASSIEKWRGKLPDQLLKYWAREGWCGYVNGLFCTVDPDEYEDIVDEWLADTTLEQIDAFHVIARSAFGDLYVCGEKTGRNVTIACPIHMISVVPKELKPKAKDALDMSIRAFFALSKPARFDMQDERGQALFERALAKLGPLQPDEIYGFEPAIVLGGKVSLENLAKVKAAVHLSILRQLGTPTLSPINIDLDNLATS